MTITSRSARLMFGLALLATAARAASLSAGSGKASITPPPDAFPYEPSTVASLNLRADEKSFTGVHDDVFARSLVLDDGEQRAILVVLDTTTVHGAQAMTRALAEAAGVDPSHVLIAATHTHGVPLFSYAGGTASAMEQREIDRLAAGALAATRMALRNLEPARVSFGRGEAWVNINNGEQAGLPGTDPAGPLDHALDVVRFQSLQGKPIAAILNYASHAEVMFRSITNGGGYEVTGDLPGAVARMIERDGSGPLTLFTSGAEGDQITLFTSLQRAGHLPAGDQGAAGWAVLDVQARKVAESALAILAAMPAGEHAVRVAAASGSVTCPGQVLHIDAKTHGWTREPHAPVDIPLATLRVGDILLGAVGGDIATAIGQRFKARSPIPHTTMITMAGQSVGYILSDAHYERPGHGLTKSVLAPGCAEPAIVDGLIKLGAN